MLKPMKAIGLALVLALAAQGLAYERALAAGPSCAGGTVTVSGIVRGLGVLQIEPQAEPQSSFFLDQADFACTKEALLVMAPGRIFCADGDTAKVTGDYMPPGGITNTPIIDGARVTCSIK